MKNLIVFLTVILISAKSDCWDLAVAVDDKIQLLDLGANKSYSTTEEFKNLQGVVYNQHDELYVVERKDADSNILSYKIGKPVQDAVNIIVEHGTRIKGIAYDDESGVLYWTTGQKGALMRYHTAWHNNSAQVFHQFENVSLYGITVDKCGRYLYWTNNQYKASTIERTRLDYFHREILIKDNLFNPMGIAVDSQTGKLFWCDDTAGSSFQVERSNLDGTEREILYKGEHDEPRTMAVAHGRIFWIDAAYGRLLSLRTRDPRGLSPLTARHWGPGTILMGVTSVVPASCSADHNTKELFPWATSAPEVTTEVATKKPVVTTPPKSYSDIVYCLNNGRVSGKYENSVPICDCPSGYSGTRCEISLCHNYCIHGSCIEENPGWPNCKCLSGYGGDRCEIDLCDGYCLNGGTCFWNATIRSPACHCPEGRFGGIRCEEDLLLFREYCHLYCRQGEVYIGLDVLEELYHCDCSDVFEVDGKNISTQLAVAVQSKSTEPQESQNATLLIACIALGCSAVALIVFLGVALRKVSILNKRPRLKKRIIVSKGVRQQELPDRRPSGQSTGEQCEITIENCCNMNICETPCYEPQIRGGKSQLKDEKKNLLGSMEGGSTAASSDNSLY